MKRNIDETSGNEHLPDPKKPKCHDINEIITAERQIEHLTPYFGETSKVIPSHNGSVDIQIFPPNEHRHKWVAITMGLSKHTMVPPEAAQIDPSEVHYLNRCELICYLPLDWSPDGDFNKEEVDETNWGIKVLRWLSNYIVQTPAYVASHHAFHEIPSVPSSDLDAAVILTPYLEPEGAALLEIDDNVCVNYYHVIPLTQEENMLRKENSDLFMVYLLDGSISTWCNPQRSTATNREARLSELIQQYTTRIERCPDESIHHFKRGGVHFRIGDYENALSDYNTAIAMDPECSDYCQARGEVKTILEDWSGAIEDFNRMINSDNEHDRSLFYRASAKMELNLYNDALEDMNQVIELVQDNEDYYILRGDVNRELNQIENALADYTSAISIDRKYYRPYMLRATLYSQMGNLLEAKNDLNKAYTLANDLEKEEVSLVRKEWEMNEVSLGT
eukprot:TRINITY_DN1907_c0_g2_i1.p1 TRINITY_DN1907_c0_g2~~TRINITY_DN1907_c0_g2_i1.p1  ORF type:complete len:448 (-),score=101.43 TRINITY_DN1907_c0_g2_i1:104-1447(-)